jgi:NADH:ubiquinone oxidoreductase subunit 5 (subunit L)/multisubunit Na+/H+ antiporter MnhA subunit
VFARGSLVLVLFHLISHAFFKRRLFIGVGTMIYYGFRDQRKRVLRRRFLNSCSQVSWLYLTLLNLSSFPFLIGFYSKERAVGRILINQPLVIVVFFWLRLSMTLAYSFRLFKRVSSRGSFKLMEGLSLRFVLLGSLCILLPLL